MGFIQSAPKHTNKPPGDSPEKDVPATKPRPQKIKTKITASRETEPRKLKETKNTYRK